MLFNKTVVGTLKKMCSKVENKKLSNMVCCVPGCKSKFKKGSSVHFYRFPSRSYESELRKKWILAIRKKK